jgi:hypothetical protein
MPCHPASPPLPSVRFASLCFPLARVSAALPLPVPLNLCFGTLLGASTFPSLLLLAQHHPLSSNRHILLGQQLTVLPDWFPKYFF